MYSIGDSVVITTNEKNVVAGTIGVVKEIIVQPYYNDNSLKTHYLVQGRGLGEGTLFNEDELTPWNGLPLENEKGPLTVEQVRMLKRDAEKKINDILEDFDKTVGSGVHVDALIFNEERAVMGKRFNIRIKVIVSS